MIKMISLFSLLFMISFIPIGFSEKPLSSAPSKAEIKDEEEKRAALREAIEAKKQELNGTSWDVEIKSQSGKGLFSGKDTLTFQDEKFHSQKADKNGYTPTNYTLTVQEDGPTIWETMQTGQEEGQVTFWRGEWKEDSMSGVISRQLKEGNEDYYFTSSAKQEIPESSEKTEEVSSEESTTSPASEPVLGSNQIPKPEETGKEVKTKKKGWFS